MAQKELIYNIGTFKTEATLVNEGLILTLAGKISEDVNFTELLAKTITALGASQGGIYFDLSQLTDINSCGVRNWLIFLERLQNQSAIEFISVNETFIEQANIVPTLLGKKGTVVREFHAPYLCQKCNKRTSKKLSPADVKVADGTCVFPQFKCLQCNQPLQFDAIEDEYLAFLNHARPK